MSQSPVLHTKILTSVDILIAYLLSLCVVEQQCAIGTITSHDANAVANTCTENGSLNALTGDKECELGCAVGYVISGTNTLTCAPDENASTGTRSGAITCTGTQTHNIDSEPNLTRASTVHTCFPTCLPLTHPTQSGCSTWHAKQSHPSL